MSLYTRNSIAFYGIDDDGVDENDKEREREPHL